MCRVISVLGPTWVCLLLVIHASYVVADRKAKQAPKQTKKPVDKADELRLAVQGAHKASPKVAAVRLKRALESARRANTAPQLLQEAEEALKEMERKHEQVTEARSSLELAIEADNPASLSRAIDVGHSVGLQGSIMGKALEALRRHEKVRRKADKRQAKQNKIWQQLRDASSEPVDVDRLRSSLAEVNRLPRNEGSSEEALLREAANRLSVAEFDILPLSERLDSASNTFGQATCRKPTEPYSGVCRTLSVDQWAELSRVTGEANCAHETLRPGGTSPAVHNAIPSETAKNFCKYPPPFNLKQVDGGYQPTHFEFPSKIFNKTALDEEGLSDLAVVNVDMRMFRNHIAPCGGRDLWLLEFYVHWCPHCMAFMPKLYSLGVALRTSGARLRAGAVNCAVQRDLCGAFGVRGHPMIAFFYGGIGQHGQVDLFDYSGQDVRVNSALQSIKKNRDPAWDAGAPKDHPTPPHLFPAEVAPLLVQLLPEGYRPHDKIMKWLGNHTAVVTACSQPRPWRGGEPGSDVFIGNGWPSVELRATWKHRLQDAAQALVYTLQEWVLPQAAANNALHFGYSEISNLHSWVGLLSTSFPREEDWGPDLHQPLMELHEQLAKKLRELEAVAGRAALCLDDWKALVTPVRQAHDEWRRRQSLPSLCRSETCRVWALLHTLSVSGLARGETSSNVSTSFAVMAGFLQRYFSCQTCRRHFVEAVEAKSFGLIAALAGGVRGLALWWWRLHVSVSVRVARDGKCNADMQWPPADVCGACWSSEGADEEHVVHWLVHTYWPLADPDGPEGVVES